MAGPIKIPATLGTGTLAEIYGASPSATPTQNRTALQQALNKGGEVSLITGGLYQTNGTVVISSNTRLRLGKNTTIQQANGVTQNLLVNAVYAAVAGIVVPNGPVLPTVLIISSMTFSAGVVTVTTSTAHGYLTGEWVYIMGSVPASQPATSLTPGYAGVWNISVTGANTFTFATPYTLPGMAVGTIMKCCPADLNITVEGGAWDYNSANNGNGGYLVSMGMLLLGMRGTNVKQTRGLNTFKEFILAGALRDADFEDMYFDTGSGGVQCEGPLENVHMRRFSGFVNDDLAVIMTQENPGYVISALSEGNCNNSSIKDMNAVTQGIGCLAALYTSTAPFVSDNIDVSNISGVASPAVVLAGPAPNPAAVGMKRCNISKVSAFSPNSNNIFIRQTNVSDLRIDEPNHWVPTTFALNAVRFYQSVLDNVQIDNLHSDFGWMISTQQAAVFIDNTCTGLNRLGMKNPFVRVHSGASQAGAVQVALASGTVATIEVDDFYFDTLQYGLRFDVPVTRISSTGGAAPGTYVSFTGNASTDARLGPITQTTGFVWSQNAAGSTATVKIDPPILSGGALLSNSGSSGTFSFVDNPMTQNVASGASITPNANLGSRIIVGILGANIAINAPVNPLPGQLLVFSYKQGGTVGGYTITYNAVFKFSILPTPGTLNQEALHAFQYSGDEWIQYGGPLLWF